MCYGSQIAIGLSHLHAPNVAHRDLPMGNILVNIPMNSVKIANLGLAACASLRARSLHYGIVVQGA
jgi:serine/threonine protein kinase